MISRNVIIDAAQHERVLAQVAQVLGTKGPLHLFRPKGLGDVLMCTPTLRELKRINPECHIHFYTDFPELVQGLPFIDHVALTKYRHPQSIWMTYETTIPSNRHLARLIGDSIGIQVNTVQPECVIAQNLVQHYKSTWDSLPRPHILMQRRAGPWTPNKDWPIDYWKQLVLSLLKTCTVIEIGLVSQEGRICDSPNYLDLRGNNRQELVACIAAGDILIAPDSGPIHIAAAVETPTVVILGGYLLRENIAYPRSTILNTLIDCSPCWLRDPCPIERECLQRISPYAVERAVMDLWNEINGASH